MSGRTRSSLRPDGGAARVGVRVMMAQSAAWCVSRA